MLLAELHIAAENFPEARRALGDLVETDPTTRSVTIMAAIERGEGASDAIVRGWLTKAVTAPRGPQWVCDSCSSIHAVWEPICSNCDAFDTLTWRKPTEGDVAMPASTEMLPLLVGQPDADAGENALVPVDGADIPDAEVIETEAEKVEATAN
jgi:HemY protein